MTRDAVLILSPDAMAAALLGAAVEQVCYIPVFAQAGEAPADSLRRTRPGVVLVDCDHETACAETFVGPAIMRGVRVVIFRSRRSLRDIIPFAMRHALPVLHLPVDLVPLRAALAGREEAATQTPSSPAR